MLLRVFSYRHHSKLIPVFQFHASSSASVRDTLSVGGMIEFILPLHLLLSPYFAAIILPTIHRATLLLSNGSSLQTNKCKHFDESGSKHGVALVLFLFTLPWQRWCQKGQRLDALIRDVTFPFSRTPTNSTTLPRVWTMVLKALCGCSGEVET